MEKAVLVTVEEIGKASWALEDREEELKSLAESCGVRIAESMTCHRRTITSDLFIGRGKAEEIAAVVNKTDADVVIFNNDLSPSQQKNLEKIVSVKTIDRTQLILDIFARRATSREGKIQVELAQLIYLLPRLSGKGIFLSRLGGGLGTRGPGEQKLEVDRRRLRERIFKLKKELKKITRQRKLRRLQREKISMLTIALIGYTNSGKSTLFNALTSSLIKVKDQLFSTLDPTVRKLVLPEKQVVLLSDTVGFLHELPHHLIESFKATLEEVINADILFHVIDMSDHRVQEQRAAVSRVLEELGVSGKPVYTVLNKVDKVQDRMEADRIKFQFRRPVVISALKKTGLSKVEDLIVEIIEKDMEDIKLVLPHKHYAVAEIIRENGIVKYEKYKEEGLFISARVPRKVKYAVFRKLRV